MVYAAHDCNTAKIGVAASDITSADTTGTQLQTGREDICLGEQLRLAAVLITGPKLELHQHCQWTLQVLVSNNVILQQHSESHMVTHHDVVCAPPCFVQHIVCLEAKATGHGMQMAGKEGLGGLRGNTGHRGPMSSLTLPGELCLNRTDLALCQQICWHCVNVQERLQTAC